MSALPEPLPPKPIDRLLTPFRSFFRLEAAGGLALMAAAAIALIWANSPFAASYEELFSTPFTIGFEGLAISKALVLWINDGLMAIFFLIVGLEIKREILIGELASPRRAALPIAAALGGAVVPAAIYLAINAGAGEPANRGWGIPMATDIAFALGVLALLGSRVPIGLKVFVTALAIVDDLLAVLVIAFFYTDDLSIEAMFAAAGIVVALMAANLLGIRRLSVYAVLGVALWVAFLQSGIHATIAGVLLALAIPARTRVDARGFVDRGRELLDRVEGPHEGAASPEDVDLRTDHERTAAIWQLEDLAEKAQAPMQRLEHGLHPGVAFVIVPIFALANAGVVLGESVGPALSSSVAWGIAFGLIVGKQVGILAACWLIVRSGLARLPSGVTWRHVYGASWLAAIGFTMSLFVGELAFAGTEVLEVAKIGIFGASVLAGVMGYLLLRFTTRPGSG
ncbi:MAG: Na+/H+ antiporter NhaA [Chloroflexota bacterium]|nr:Na+/H+ antiporter NhaA [Chloroflexota bacterium]